MIFSLVRSAAVLKLNHSAAKRIEDRSSTTPAE
jgi:hypothetical protein